MAVSWRSPRQARNPAHLAKMVATLQFLSGGRYILGIGAGGREEEYLAYGYDADGTSMANPVSMLLADGRWRIAHTVSPAEADYPLPFSLSAYYGSRMPDEG